MTCALSARHCNRASLSFNPRRATTQASAQERLQRDGGGEGLREAGHRRRWRDHARGVEARLPPVHSAGLGAYNSQFVEEIHEDADTLFNSIDTDNSGEIS